MHNVYVARPAPACNGCDQILPVDWNGIVCRGETATNFQLLPGDRVYVGADPFITLDTRLGRLLNPIERIFGFILLGNSTIINLRDPASTGGGGNNGGTGTGTGAGGF
jgi:hypothetical protein